MTGDEQDQNENGKSQKRGKNALREFVLKPPLWLDIIVWAATAASIGLAVSVLCLDIRGETWAFALYLLALVLSVASLYLALTFGDVPKRIAKSRNVKRFVADFGFRTYVVSICSAAVNGLYAVFGTVLAAVSRSVWLGALVWYHIVLALCRAFVFFYVKRRGGSADVERINIRAYTISGVALIVMAMAIVPIILLVVRQRNSYMFFGGALVYVCALALYTVIKLAISIAGRRRARKSGDMSLKAIRNISFASALISVFALQATMLVAMEDAALAATLNPVTGSTVAFCIAAMGVAMMIGGIVAQKRRDKNMYDRRADGGMDSTDRKAENGKKPNTDEIE